MSAWYIKPLESTTQTSEVAFSSTPVNAKPKRNRGGRCPNPDVHLAHDTCPGRERRLKSERPVVSSVVQAVDAAWHLGMLQMSKVDKAAIGIISDEDREFYDLDLEQYETVSEAISREGGVQNRKTTIVSFYTTVKRANDIILEYADQKLLPLTLRQIHYQMVVRHKDYPNNKDSYTHMTSDLVAARMAGLVPWNAIDDPSRGLHSQGSWDSVEQAIRFSSKYYHVGRWQNQDKWPLVLVEKDAALGIISRACDDLDVPYVSLKGYGSVTVLRNTVADHCLRVFRREKEPVIIHLSDLDASGWDMGRNLTKYLNKMVDRTVDIRHIALTLDQVLEGYGDGNPLPPDPVKHTDPRAKKFIEWQIENGLAGNGREPGAWEMDALRPEVLHNIIVDEIDSCREMGPWEEIEEKERIAKQAMSDIAEHMNDPLPNAGEMA